MEARYFVIIITRHAEDRIKERTKLTPEDVKCFLENDAFYPLGKDGKGKGELFYLFFSRPDNTFFVAVLTADKTFLQTVLCQHHTMPVKIKKSHHRKARQSYNKWFLDRNTAVTEEKPALALLRVCVKNKRMFSLELGEVLLSKYTSRVNLYFEHADIFQIIIQSMTEWLVKNGVNGKSVKYEFFVKPEWSKNYQLRHTLEHKVVLQLIESHKH